MTREDERILEYLDSEEWATPTLVSEHAIKRCSPGHVRERLQLLRYAGLVDRFGENSWELTTKGAGYLGGQIDAGHLPTPTVDRVLRG